MRRWLVLCLSLCVGVPAAAAEDVVSFRQQIVPIFQQECVYCHMREDSYGFLVLEDATSYGSLVGVPASELPSMNRVHPGEPENSYLWRKLKGTHVEAGGSGWRMPFHPLSDTHRTYIRQWIEQGALDN